MNPFIAQIVIFGGNFAPRGWSLCQGQLLAISSHSALFSLIGTIYGGDGRTTCALPDLRGRVPVQHGNGPGLSPVSIGEKGGRENVTLTTLNLPAHSHTLTGQVKLQAGGGKGTATSAGGFIGAANEFKPQGNGDNIGGLSSNLSLSNT